jgi:ribosomal-protein-alanine N-acetyltransferase
MNSLLVGPRVQLRPFTLADVEGVFAYAGDAMVTRYLEWDPHLTWEDSARFIEASRLRQAAGCTTLGVERLADGAILGACELRVVDSLNRIGEIGYALAPRHWGQGYNVEAGRLLLDYGFAGLHLLRIQGMCDVDNRPSFRTMEKLGMVRERLLPRYRWRAGRQIDRYLYGILWREWARLDAARERSEACG